MCHGRLGRGKRAMVTRTVCDYDVFLIAVFFAFQPFFPFAGISIEELRRVRNKMCQPMRRKVYEIDTTSRVPVW